MRDETITIPAHWEHRTPASDAGETETRCSRCGKTAENETRFCAHCGSGMSDYPVESCWIRFPMFGLLQCSWCGMTTDKETPYCPHCGAAMIDTERNIRVYAPADNA